MVSDPRNVSKALARTWIPSAQRNSQAEAEVDFHFLWYGHQYIIFSISKYALYVNKIIRFAMQLFRTYDFRSVPAYLLTNWVLLRLVLSLSEGVC